MQPWDNAAAPQVRADRLRSSARLAHSCVPPTRGRVAGVEWIFVTGSVTERP